MSDDIKNIRNSVKELWSDKEVANSYNISAAQLGSIDEKHIEKFINSYFPKEKKTIVDLGIGGGRELVWLDKVKNVQKVIGVDYSKAMIDACKKNIAEKKIKVKVSLIHKDILQLDKEDISGTGGSIKIFLFLLNSLGNNIREEQIRILNSVKKLMERKDLLIMTLYKYPEKLRISKEFLEEIPRHLDSYEKKKVYEILDYVFVPFLWQIYYRKYKKIPVFWYNKETKNVEVYIGKKLVFMSHRWDEKEIKDVHQVANLKIKKIIDGDLMYISIAEKSKKGGSFFLDKEN